MRKTIPGIVYICLFLVSFAACARLQKPVDVHHSGRVILMTASDFKFEPNNITTRAGNSLTFSIMNVSPNSHNFTLTDPDGKIMKDVDIARQQSVQVDADFPVPGTYKFFCDKTGHSELGMKGQVVVTP